MYGHRPVPWFRIKLTEKFINAGVELTEVYCTTTAIPHFPRVVVNSVEVVTSMSMNCVAKPTH